MSKQINQIAALLHEMGMDKEDIGEVIELINDILEGNNYDEECSDDDISDNEIEDAFANRKPQQKTLPQTQQKPTAPSRPQQSSNSQQKSQGDSSSVITSIKGTTPTLSMSKVMDCIPVGGGVQTLVNRFVDFCKSKNIDPESARKVINVKLGKRTKIVDVNLYVEGSVTTSDIIGCLKK